MANIQEYLRKIKSAIYGRDVRDSIHDAIDAINTEVEEAYEEIDEFVQSEMDTTLTSTELPAQGKAVGDAIEDVVIASDTQPTSEFNQIWIDEDGETEYQVPTYSEFSEVKNAINDLAENGYYTESSGRQYIQTEIGQVRNGSPASINTGSTNTSYAKLTSAQESVSINFDATKYKCNLAYFNNDVKVEYTGWFESSPITVDNTITHDEVYINVRKLSGDMDNTEILTCLYYEESTLVGNLATKDYAVAKQQDISDSGKVLGIGLDGNVTPVEQSAGVHIDDTLSVADDAADAKKTGDTIKELAENGYYSESSTETHYLELEAYGIKTDGTTDNRDQKAHIWLTSAQEALTLNFDASVYKYNLCYKNSGSVVQYTSWVTESPIEISDIITHDQVGITITTLNDSLISSDDLNNIIYYQTGGTTTGNLATKDYAVAKQQSTSDAGKTLVIGLDGVVAPGTPQVQISVDDTLSISGDAADAKVTGDTIKELAENGVLILRGSPEYLMLTAGKYSTNSNTPFDQIISTSSDTGYVKIPKSEIPDELCFDVTKYKANTCFIKNGYMISGTFTAWTTASPILYAEPSDYDYISIMVKKLSGDYVSGELSQALYGISSQTVGNLATKAYVDSAVASINPRGRKVIYPDDFSSRIKPNIYYNGRYYADIDYNNYKIAGSGNVWVSTDGNDSTGDGSESNPYATITKALTTVAKTIHVKEGTYTQGTHYTTSVDIGGRNLIGHGTVTLQNDSEGHYVKANTSAYFENIIFKHGNTSSNSAFVSNCYTSGNTLCFVGCTFCDGAANGLYIKGTDAILIDCIAYGNKLDGFNYHDNTYDGVTYISNVLEIDCIVYNNGSSDSGSDSCNGSTAHDGTKIIRLNGEYYSCYGGVIAEIARTGEEPTISVNYGVLAHDSTGTGTYKASFWASINTQMYLYDCSSYGGTYDISAINDAKIVSWRLTTGRDEPSVNEASTATVIQH